MLVLQRRLPAGNRGESPVGGPGAKRRNGAKLGLAVLTVTLGERKKGCFPEAGEGKARVKVAGHINGIAPNPKCWANSALCPVTFASSVGRMRVRAQFFRVCFGSLKIGHGPW